MNKIPQGDIWVYAYGSLMWQPNFPYLEKRHAHLQGYHRALCIYSVEYRGTREKPGLVFGLNTGGSCRGMAFKISAHEAENVIAYLHEREMITGVYTPRWQPVDLCAADGTPTETVLAYIFVADPTHSQYTGTLDDDEIVRLVKQGHGKSGPCIDYLQNTLDHLNDLGIQDPALTRIIGLVTQTE